MEFIELRGNTRQNEGAWDCACSYKEAAGNGLSYGSQIILKFFEVVQYGQSARIKQFRLQSRNYRAAQAIKESAVQAPLKIADMFTDGGLAGIELICSLGKTSVLIDRNEYF
jgi:hypothetical protein